MGDFIPSLLRAFGVAASNFFCIRWVGIVIVGVFIV
jgi:hypothetical protein